MSMGSNRNSIRVLVASTGGIKNDGITSWIKAVFGAMDLEGIEVDVVAWSGTDRDVTEAVRKIVTNVHILPSRQKDPLGYVRALRKLTESRRYDVFHICGSSGLVALELAVAAASGVPVRIAHSHNTTCQHAALDKVSRPLMRKLANSRLACGTDAGKWLFGNDDFVTIPNGKNISNYAFDADARRMVREKLAIPHDAVAIGHVGRFNEQKNHAKLLEVFQDLRNRSTRYKLVLIGDGGLLPETRELASKLGIGSSVLFLGRRSDVPFLLNALDCMILPSLYEGFPNVVLEWQINGLPCIVSNSVTRECAVTPLVRFASLSEPASAWAAYVEEAFSQSNRGLDSKRAARDASEAGYDIKKNAAMLREIYLKGVLR